MSVDGSVYQHQLKNLKSIYQCYKGMYINCTKLYVTYKMVRHTLHSFPNHVLMCSLNLKKDFAVLSVGN